MAVREKMLRVCVCVCVCELLWDCAYLSWTAETGPLDMDSKTNLIMTERERERRSNTHMETELHAPASTWVCVYEWTGYDGVFYNTNAI